MLAFYLFIGVNVLGKDCDISDSLISSNRQFLLLFAHYDEVE